ncbi:hypothetical protein EVAR_24841_1 [Eumeta japonica]|uniref:Uncharacterized protein n=1 Tax=Eumeta variegata TaxID=151549 RepID=A0A4C1YA74_EUMVA|nr:hypothetical protein EVAR_24841_1 [Eumeta japonica]
MFHAWLKEGQQCITRFINPQPSHVDIMIVILKSTAGLGLPTELESRVGPRLERRTKPRPGLRGWDLNS